MKSNHSLRRYLFRASLAMGPAALVLFACGGSKSASGKPAALATPAEPGIVGDVDPDRAARYGNTKASKVGIELLDPGKEPRSLLKYEAKENYGAVASWRTTIKNQPDNSTLLDRSFIVMALVDSTGSANFSVTYVIQADHDGELIDDPDRVGEANTKSFGATVKYSSFGKPTGFEPFADDEALFKKYQSEVMGMMSAPSLPAEPVGIGAKWQIHIPVSLAQPVRSDKVTISELVSVEGSVITIETTTRADVPSQKINGRQVEGQKIRYTKRTLVDLADPVSILPQSYELSQDLEQTLKKAGTTVTQHMTTTIRSSRIGDAALID